MHRTFRLHVGTQKNIDIFIYINVVSRSPTTMIQASFRVYLETRIKLGAKNLKFASALFMNVQIFNPQIVLKNIASGFLPFHWTCDHLDIEVKAASSVTDATSVADSSAP